MARLRRLTLRLTQAEVAQAAGLSREQVGRVEIGGVDSRISTLRAIAGALDCTVGDLLNDESPAAQPGSVTNAAGGVGAHDSM